MTMSMTMRTITALFDSARDAERAREQLGALGLRAADIRIVSQQSTGTGAQTADDKGIWESIKDFFLSDEDRQEYREGLRRGGYLLTARVEEGQAEQAIEILERSDAVDLDERADAWRTEGWRGQRKPQESQQAIPIAEERLRVGKREVDRGTVRVRSYVVEEPVHEDVRLRDERVEVERRPMTGEARSTDPNLLQERAIEMRETSEEPVVSKDSVVKEEVVVRKFTGERTEGVDETVRRTEVDVDDSRTSPEPTPGSTGRKPARKSEERRRTE